MGNIVSGHELISRMGLEEVFGRVSTQITYVGFVYRDNLFVLVLQHRSGLTIPLVTNEEGSKLGKTAGNAIWISATKTSPFEFYQFFVRTKDADVAKLLKLFTFRNQDEIDQIISKQMAKPESRIAQRTLAEQVTLLVHGGYSKHIDSTNF